MTVSAIIVYVHIKDDHIILQQENIYAEAISSASIRIQKEYNVVSYTVIQPGDFISITGA